MLTEIRHNFTGINSRDSRDALSGTPFGKALHGGPMAMLQGIVLHNDTRGLEVRRFEVSEQSVLVLGRGGNSIITNQGLCEDENLTAVGGIGHRLGVSDERGGEDSFARDVGFGAERLSGKDWSILSGGEQCAIQFSTYARTLIVNVALSVEMGVDFRAGAGTIRGVL